MSSTLRARGTGEGIELSPSLQPQGPVTERTGALVHPPLHLQQRGVSVEASFPLIPPQAQPEALQAAVRLPADGGGAEAEVFPHRLAGPQPLQAIQGGRGVLVDHRRSSGSAFVSSVPPSDQTPIPLHGNPAVQGPVDPAAAHHWVLADHGLGAGEVGGFQQQQAAAATQARWGVRCECIIA
jgi:hypothetical protein